MLDLSLFERPLPQPTGKRLRQLQISDAARIQELAGERAVAETTSSIPHPYPDGAAEAWIGARSDCWRSGQEVVFANCPAATGHLLGCVGLILNTRDCRAELGYWVGRPYWGLGHGRAAAAEMVAYGFDVLGLARIHAKVIPSNLASGRICRALGMRHEGRLRQDFIRWGQSFDLDLYGILRAEFLASAAPL